jgi:outer membrane protein
VVGIQAGSASGGKETYPMCLMMNSLWAIAGAALLASFVSPDFARAESIKIGHVDLQRALNDSQAGKNASAEFKIEVEKQQATLKRQKADIDNLKKELEKKPLVMKQGERKDLEEDYREKLRDFERTYKDSQSDLQRKDKEMTDVIIKDLEQIIQHYGEREAYTLILEARSETLYGSPSIGDDLTPKIIEEYDEARVSTGPAQTQRTPETSEEAVAEAAKQKTPESLAAYKLTYEAFIVSIDKDAILAGKEDKPEKFLLTENTKFLSEDGRELKESDFQKGDRVRITFNTRDGKRIATKVQKGASRW